MATKIDQIRIEERVEAILHEICQDSTCRQMFVDHNALYEACRLQHTLKSKFSDIVDDTLTGHRMCKSYGHFVYVQIDGSTWAFIRVCKTTSELREMSARRVTDFEDLYKE